MTTSLMPNWLKQRARLTPERTAIQTDQDILSFLELEEEVAKLATELSESGVAKGTRVALLQANTLDLVISYHALIYLEAVAIPLNNRLTQAELQWHIQDSEATFVLYDKKHEQTVQSFRNNVVTTTLVSVSTIREKVSVGCPISFPDEIALDALHTIIYTSGTTGHPKGVRLSFGNHWWSAIGSALNLGLGPDDHWLCVVPLFHVSGLSILMKSVIYGMKITLMERFEAKKVNQAILNKGITHVSVVSTMLQAMIEDADWVTYPKALRCMLLGGGPAPLPLLNKCMDHGVPVYQTYGLSETASQIVTLAPEYMLSKMGSAGRPLFPAQIKIIKDGESLGENQDGEIVVKGPNVTSGYDHLPDANDHAIKEGWLHTGDMGRLDDEGFLYVLDRRKDLIVSGGENIYPAEIESVLLAHPDVLEAGVVGIRDQRWGRVPVGFVVLREGIEFNQDHLLAHCREQLAGYKVPRQLIRVDQLPRNASRKILRRELVALLPEHLRED